MSPTTVTTCTAQATAPQFTQANGLRICWDSVGDPQAEAVLLLPGLGTQLLRWSPSFCKRLVEQGFRVLRMDLRDAGLSSHLHDAGVPAFAELAAALAAGQRPQVPYTLHDMVADVTGLLDALQLERVHLVGRSMGGMLAQLLAGSQPQRVRSLCTIMSSSGNPRLPQADPEVMGLMMRPGPRPEQGEEAYLDHAMVFAQRIASPAYFDAQAQRALLRAELQRAYNPAGTARQVAAIAATGDLHPWLAQITAPTLVVHGAEDVLIPPACGRDSAEAIAGAEWLLLPGMGHDLPAALEAQIADAITRNARR